MVGDGLFTRIAVPDVALVQHLLPSIAGTVATVVLAAMIGP